MASSCENSEVEGDTEAEIEGSANNSSVLQNRGQKLGYEEKTARVRRFSKKGVKRFPEKQKLQEDNGAVDEDDTQDPTEDEQQLGRIKDWISLGLTSFHQFCSDT